jgi:PAS domain S-box-containing protein
MNPDIESEEKLRSQLRVLFESSQAGIILVDPSGAIILANKSAAEMFGCSMDELLRTRYLDHVHSDQRNAGDERMRKVIAGEVDRITTERHYIRKDGSDFWGHISVRRHEDSEGNLISLVGHITDISELKLKERLLKDSEKKFRMLFEHSADPSLLIIGNSFVDCNQAAVEILLAGSKEELLNTHPSVLSPEYQPDGRLSSEKANDMINTAVSKGSHRFDWVHCRINGELFPVEVSLTLIEEAGQAVIFTVWRDITDRKRAEEEITREKEFSIKAMNSLPGVFYIISPSLKFVRWNENFEKVTGYASEELARISPLDLFCGTDRDLIMDRMQEVFVSGSSDAEAELVSKSGKRIPYRFTGKTIKVDGVDCLIGMGVDITESRQKQELLKESEERFRSIIENLQDVYYRSDAEGLLAMISPSGVKLFGYAGMDEMLGCLIRETLYYDPGERDAFIQDLKAKGYLYNHEVTLRHKNGTPIPVATSARLIFDADGTFCGVEGVFRDISEMKATEVERLKLEQQLLHAQKLESLGVLAGGIAHDFNNILTAIIGNADLALMRINKESPAVDNLHMIEKAAARAADLAKQMLAYSGKGKFVVEHLDLNLLLEEMLHMLEVSISKKAVLRMNLHQPLPSVEADATQMRQIIMNLVINASEAIGDKSGVIAITTGCMDCDRSYLKDVWLDENLTDGLYVYLEIADTGCGMDKETLSKLFDPFFTTKFTGRGLGMAAVLGIVRGHKGAIKVYSEPDKGTSFKILLPSSGKPAELFNGNNHHDDWQGAGTVLLVDDEETVRGIGGAMLKELGFTTITANDGREAVEIFKNNPDIAFVILDLTMPHMDGEQCFRELRQMKPDIKVIMSSGYNEQEVTQRFVGKGLAGFIQKPYKLSVLKEAIKRIDVVAP